jgi:tetratricopeptide (TPR) repeat protein
MPQRTAPSPAFCGRREFRIYCYRAILRYRLGDLEGARADGDLAVKLEPGQALVRPEFSQATVLKGNLDWALDYYEQAIKKLPKSPLPYRGRAEAYFANGDAGRAIVDYTQAIQFAPRQAEIYLERGRAYQQLGDLRRATEDFYQALKLSDKSHLRRQARKLLRAVGS